MTTAFLKYFACFYIYVDLQLNGRWDGEIFYTYTEGPRAGKKDVESWVDGEMKSSKKFYGKGEEVLVENWDDLQKLENLTQQPES